MGIARLRSKNTRHATRTTSLYKEREHFNTFIKEGSVFFFFRPSYATGFTSTASVSGEASEEEEGLL